MILNELRRLADADCDLHHIRHWLKHQGPTDLANLCLLCRRHHTLTHAIGYTFRRRADGFLMIHRPDGTPLADPGHQSRLNRRAGSPPVAPRPTSCRTR